MDSTQKHALWAAYSIPMHSVSLSFSSWPNISSLAASTSLSRSVSDSMSPSSSQPDSTDVAIGTHESMATSETDGDAFSGRLLQSIHLHPKQ